MTVSAARSASLPAFDLATAQDVFALRRIGQSAAKALGMDPQDQVRIATALSELGRDRLGCDGLTVAFNLPTGPEPVLAVVFEWDGGTKAAPDLEPASRLLNRVRHESCGARERIVAEHPLPTGWADTPDARLGVREALRRHAPMTLADDLRAQTRDLIATLEETRAQREELRRLNDELEETNRGSWRSTPSCRRSWRRRTAVSWPSTPNWRRSRSGCGRPARPRRASGPTSATSSAPP